MWLRERDGHLYLGVFLVSMAILLLQIALTRIFSFTLWYHFAYVTISVALLGYGASGAFLAVFPGLAGSTPARRLPLYAIACGITIVTGLYVFAEVPFHPFEMMTILLVEPTRQVPRIQFAYLILYYLTVTAPFFFAGLCVSVALKTLSQHVSRLYFFDLVGAGMGCLIVIFVISALSTPGAVLAAAVIVSLAGVVFALGDTRGRLAFAMGGTLAVALLGIWVLTRVEFEPSPEKFAYAFLKDTKASRVYRHQWSPIFRTDSFGYQDEEQSRRGSYAGWGISPHWKERAATEGPKLRMITHDGDAGAVIYNFDGDLAKLEMFEHLILKTPYLLLENPNVLVIGVGGGTDIVNAIKNRARHVTGIELDPVTVEMVRRDHADFAGRLFERSDVTIIVGEGRSTLRHSDAKYDLIQMTGVDTLAALSTGAYVLSESYLYTTEAIHEFLDHLTPNGVLSVVVADWLGGPVGVPRHTMRQLSLFLEALHERGIEDAEKRIAVIASPERVPQVSMLLKNSPFTRGEVDRLNDFAERMGFQVWALPGVPLETVHSRYLRTPRAARPAFLGQYPLIILTPTNDDNPFFFNFYPWRYLGRSRAEVDAGHTLATGQIIMVLILLLAIVFSTLLVLLPLFVFQRRGLRTTGKWGFIVFFSAIGLGFVLIEISFIQKFVLFLGYPTYSLTVVLFSLLTYSGIGSFLTGRMRRPPEGRFLFLFAGLATVSVLYLAVLPTLFQAFLGSPFALRVLIASVALAPLGLVMGTFFPSGMQMAHRANVEFVPWAWGINGCASVVGTVLAVMVAMSYGFRAVTLLALATYLAGVLGIRASARALSG